MAYCSLAFPEKRSLLGPDECEKCLWDRQKSVDLCISGSLTRNQHLERFNCIKKKRQQKTYPPEQLRLVRHKFLCPSSCRVFSSDTKVLIAHQFLPLSRCGCFHSHVSQCQRSLCLIVPRMSTMWSLVPNIVTVMVAKWLFYCVSQR